jgi:geranylgeranyl diphosphate synthase type II
MRSFQELSVFFEQEVNKRFFPEEPKNLYDAAQYIIGIGGKRVRPILVLMGNEIFGEVGQDAFKVAASIELFHNFSLIHDDIMDKAPLRRGAETVHIRYGESTALLAGDVMLVRAYEEIASINASSLASIFTLFNRTAKEVCEGQQMDMDFENRAEVLQNEYLQMITLKTSVLLAASLQMGAILGGADDTDQAHLYEFGKNLGIAFQLQDDYLDAFGDPDKFGKQVGGDIIANKKTFLLIYALENANPQMRNELIELLGNNEADKVSRVLQIFRACGVDQWANAQKEHFFNLAMNHLHALRVDEAKKKPLIDLAGFLIQRES